MSRADTINSGAPFGFERAVTNSEADQLNAGLRVPLHVPADCSTAAVRAFIRAPFTMQGGYPLYAIADDSGALCAKCCRDEWYQVCYSMRNEISDGWRVTAIDVNYESDIDCDNCGDMIAAAYLDDDERAAKRKGCDQCSELMIQGVRCHETGCPNTPRTNDAEHDPFYEHDTIGSTI